MAARLSFFLPRFAALTVIALLATATITFAAENQMLSAPAPAVEEPAAAPRFVTLPDVRGQAYVFAKSTLEEAGLAWRVTGPVQGYAANVVVSQTPVPGTRVVDTGAPTVALGLERNTRYPQKGLAESSSPYAGTAIRFAAEVAAKPKSAAKPKPAARPPAKPKPSSRPPAFVVPGAKVEPLDEIALPARARLLSRWLETHRTMSGPNVRHWLYQHAWIVEGARMGWWHGAEALELLVAADERVQELWGIGARSEAVARRALDEVRVKSVG